MDIQEYIQSGIIESYVLGLATAEEVEELEFLRLQYPEIDDSIDEFAVAVERQAKENAIMPPSDVKQRVMEALKAEKVLEPTVTPVRDNIEHLEITLNSIRPWRMTAAAAVILLVVSAALNFYWYRQYQDKNTAYQSLVSERNSLQANNQVFQTHLQEWQSAAAMMADPAMATVKMNGIPGKESNMATVFWDTRNKDVYVMPNKLPAPSAGTQYQLWAIVDGKPVDAGTLDPNCTGACKMKNIPKAQAFAITVEKEGGSPTPTLEAMLVQGAV